MSAAQISASTVSAEHEPLLFVLNLCSSTTPMALNYPATPELKRFTFFVSRRREDGRERFRLHMGYFTTMGEAEEWLALVRDIYPGAWAGEAPGKKLRAASRAPVPQAPPAPASAPSAQQSPTPIMPAPAAAPLAPPAFVPTLHAPPTLLEPPVVHPAAPRPNAFEESNLKEVLAQLETTAPPALTDTQVLALLEKREQSKQPSVAQQSIRLLKPDDTVTRRALSSAVQHNTPVSFAVQLQWSVQPVDLTRVPPLAIFNAYTLYTIDGNREGRKWYGLRLGFFSDANSAKQVAQYVRSEFSSVAVVPVSPQEFERASTPAKPKAASPPDSSPSGVMAAAASRVAASKAVPGPRNNESGEFRLVDDAPRRPPAAEAAVKSPIPAVAPLAQVRAAAASGAKSLQQAAQHKGTRGKPAKTYRAPQTLEETLEILGASEIEIDNGRGELLNDTGVRHLEVTVQKNSPFSRLLERITERVRRG